jgi:hypothetical protein
VFMLRTCGHRSSCGHGLAALLVRWTWCKGRAAHLEASHANPQTRRLTAPCGGARARAQATQAAALLSLGQLTLARMLEAFVGGVVGLNVSHLAVTDLALAPGASISESAAGVALRAELLAAPSDSYNTPVVRSTCAAPAVRNWGSLEG